MLPPSGPPAPGAGSRMMSTTTEPPSLTVYVALPMRNTPGWSSSTIVKVAVEGLDSRAPPVGAPSVISTLRLPSTLLLLTVGIMKNAWVSFGLNVSVPDTGPGKSTPGKALTLEMLYGTTAWVTSAPERTTTILPCVPSLVSKAAWANRMADSSSTMVTTAVDGVPSVTPCEGLLSVTLKVSFPSASVSWKIGMRTVLVVTLRPNTTVVETLP